MRNLFLTACAAPLDYAAVQSIPPAEPVTIRASRRDKRRMIADRRRTDRRAHRSKVFFAALNARKASEIVPRVPSVALGHLQELRALTGLGVQAMGRIVAPVIGSFAVAVAGAGERERLAKKYRIKSGGKAMAR
jgi:hypothetical protein